MVVHYGGGKTAIEKMNNAASAALLKYSTQIS